jgi:hypothetical protein
MGGEGNALFLANIINNRFISGTNSRLSGTMELVGGMTSGSKIYIKGNITPQRTSDSQDDWTGVSGGTTYRSNTPGLQPSGITIDSVDTAYTNVLAKAGAIYPYRDPVDTRVVQSVQNKTGKIIDSQNDVGGWPILPAGTPPTDSDHDGMPDNWETGKGLNPQTNDSAKLAASGYSMLEEYVNSLIGGTGGVVPTQPGGVTTSPGLTIQPTSGTGGIAVALSVFLHGIGKGGDNSNPTSTGNTSPKHPQRSVTLELYNSSNTLVTTKPATLNFQPATGNFTGSVNLGSIAAGSYTAKVKVQQYLKKGVPGILSITSASQNIQVPSITLVTGDANNDNVLSILDYNMILDCFSDLTPAKNCNDANKKVATDLTDDGNVNQFDYNLFLRELSVQVGE